MMNAGEAKETSILNRQEIARKFTNHCYAKIEEAARKAYTSVRVHECPYQHSIRNEMMEELKRMGYAVSYRSGSGMMISW